MRLIISTLMLLISFTYSFAQINESAQPLQYPEGVVSNTQPYLIWCDIYNTGNKPFVVTVTITNLQGQSNEYTLYPEIIDGMYCVVQIPVALTPDTYTYTIKLLHNNKPENKRYYHHKKYPVEGTFTVDTTKPDPVDSLDKTSLIYYLSQSRQNKLHYGYNALFFSSSGTISLGTGVAVYYLTNFGIVTTIISAVAITSGVIGITAGIYYGVKYYQNKNVIEDVIKK
ncbi:MAG: hypothetical protein GYA16_07060 [Spirochaetes bacterium]|nr:hypothetical protein [Spirochaetota bacterium]